MRTTKNLKVFWAVFSSAGKGLDVIDLKPTSFPAAATCGLVDIAALTSGSLKHSST
jgi:hypothetical protein